MNDLPAMHPVLRRAIIAARSAAHVAQPVREALRLSEQPLAAIKSAVSAATGVKVFDIVSRRRFGPVVEARQIAMYLCKLLTPHSYVRIAMAFGDRNHTTVMDGVHKIAARVAADPEFAARVEAIRESIEHA